MMLRHPLDAGEQINPETEGCGASVLRSASTVALTIASADGSRVTAKGLLTTLSLVAVLTAGVGAAHASVVFDNGQASGGGGDSISPPWMTANSFTLATSDTLQAATVGVWDNSASHSAYFDGIINYAVYSDVSSKPGTILTSGTVTGLTGVPAAFGSEDVSFNFVTPFTASAGTTYFFYIETTGIGGSSEFWELSADPLSTNGTAQSNNGGTSWSHNGTEHAFQLLDSQVAEVPEPASLALIGFGAAALGMLRRQRA